MTTIYHTSSHLSKNPNKKTSITICPPLATATAPTARPGAWHRSPGLEFAHQVCTAGSTGAWPTQCHGQRAARHRLAGGTCFSPLGSDTTLMATRNPVNSPVEMVNIPLFTGFYTSQVVVFGKLLDSVFFFKLCCYTSWMLDVKQWDSCWCDWVTFWTGSLWSAGIKSGPLQLPLVELLMIETSWNSWNMEVGTTLKRTLV